jgi:hypothetical protein
MLLGRSAQAILKATEQEKSYEWLAAVDSYRQALDGDSANAILAPDIWGRIGHCYLMTSRQAGNAGDFRKLVQLAVDAHTTAGELWRRGGEPRSASRSLRQYALAEYARSWSAPSPADKKESLARSCELAKKSLENYAGAGEELDRGRTYNDLQMSILERLSVASDSEEMKSLALEGIRYSDQAIEILSMHGDKSELLRAYSTASLLGWYVANFVEIESQQELAKKSLSYSEKALELSREVDDHYLVAMSNWAAALCTLVFTEKAEIAQKYAEKMLEHGASVKDNYLKGVACYLLAFVMDWMMVREADPDTQKDGYRKIINYAEDAAKCLQPVGQDFYIAETDLFYAESLSNLGRYVEKGSKEKRILLEKAASVGREAVEHATRSGSPDAEGSALHALSKALHYLSTISTQDDEKTKLLQEALACRQRSIDGVIEKAFPSNDWLRGVNKTYQGLIKKDLEKIERDETKKRALLESAVNDLKDGVSHCGRWVASRPVPSQIATLASYEDRLGALLNDLYALTGDNSNLSRAVEVHEDAAEQFRKAGLLSRAAESRWKIARNQHRLGDALKAAESFEKAFEDYTLAAKNNPKFADVYDDYACYMKAWSEIEKASSAHGAERYSDAAKHYEKTEELLRQTKSWSYLSLNFSAWSLLEHGEDMSRRESSVESIDTFQKAADRFKEAKRSLETEIARIQNLDEQEMAIELGKASVRRMNYCVARTALEEARILDRKGNHQESAEMYDSAAQLFEKIMATLDTDVDRKEFEPILYMCRAWQKMKLADKAASPELYREASELFLKAKERSTSDKSMLLASGNGAFCRALENGTEFESTREKEHFLKTKQYLESAANYYLKAGFESASVWTNATEMLFDAYNYKISAETEPDPNRKTKMYLLAEKCLERSARLYEKAGYTGKHDEVLKILNNVEEKRRFALSLSDMLTAPTDVSSPRAISAPRLTVEQPVGLLKFEHALIEANLIVQQRDVLVGESFNIEVQLLNLGRDSAFLLRVKDLIPSEFALVQKPEKCVVKDGLLDLKGRRLQPLESDQITVKVKSTKRGKFTFTPAIQFVDEAGNDKVCELEQVTITVREMGIRSWLKGR